MGGRFSDKWVCAECGRTFSGRRNANKSRKYFCSGKCFKRARTRRTSVFKKCAECCKPIKVKLSLHLRGDGKYCGTKCCWAGLSRKKKIGKPYVFYCQNCESRVESREFSRRLTKKFCSMACKKEYTKKKHEKKCRRCARLYNSSGRGKFFCSRRCMFMFRGMNSIELAVAGVLDEIGVGFRTNANPLYNFTYPDFLIKNMKVAIYVDGKYWHRNTAPRDRLQDKVLRSIGFTVIRIPEADVRKSLLLVKGRILHGLGRK